MSDEGTTPRAAPDGGIPRPQAPWNAPQGNAPQWTATPQWAAPPRPPAPVPAPASPFAAPYAVAPRGSFVQAPAPRRAALGLVALVIAVLAAAGASALGAVAAFRVGLGTDRADFASAPTETSLDFLSPVRDWVLLGEVSFWIGTVLGVWAIVQGIIAIASRRGRVAAIVAVGVAVIGPVVFFISFAVAVGIGLDAVSGMTASR